MVQLVRYRHSSSSPVNDGIEIQSGVELNMLSPPSIYSRSDVSTTHLYRISVKLLQSIISSSGWKSPTPPVAANSIPLNDLVSVSDVLMQRLLPHVYPRSSFRSLLCSCVILSLSLSPAQKQAVTRDSLTHPTSSSGPNRSGAEVRTLGVQIQFMPHS